MKRSIWPMFVVLILLGFQKAASVAQPMRIISLAPNITETLFALGVGGQVVGVTTYCDFPQEVAAVHKVGNFLSPNFEEIVSRNPTLVLAEKWPSSKTVTRLRQLRVPVIEVVSPASIAEIYAFTTAIGQAIGRQEQAERLNADLRHRLHRAEIAGKALNPPPRIYVEIDLPTWTVGEASFITEAIHLAGGRNVFADSPLRALQASHEAIVARNPEVILSFEAKRPEIEERHGWDQIEGVRHHRIIDDLNRDLLSRGDYRLAEGVEALQKRLLSMRSSASLKSQP